MSFWSEVIPWFASPARFCASSILAGFPSGASSLLLSLASSEVSVLLPFYREPGLVQRSPWRKRPAPGSFGSARLGLRTSFDGFEPREIVILCSRYTNDGQLSRSLRSVVTAKTQLAALRLYRRPVKVFGPDITPERGEYDSID
jgi:hypothetical protein